MAPLNTDDFTDATVYDENSGNLAVHTVQLERSALLISNLERVLPDIVVRRFTTNQSLSQRIRVPTGWTTFVLVPNTCSTPATWCGIDVQPGSLGILRSGHEHDVSLPADWHSLEVDVPDDILIDEKIVAESLLDHALNPGKGLLLLSDSMVNRLAKKIESILISRTLTDNIRPDPDQLQHARGSILGFLTTAIDSACPPHTLPLAAQPHRRYSLVNKAQKLIRNQLQSEININTLSKELGTSPRALQRAFKKHYAISPYQYLLGQRLDAAHRELRANQHGCSITDIAHRYRFSSASRFSEQYKRMYGELPSKLQADKLTP